MSLVKVDNKKWEEDYEIVKKEEEKRKEDKKIKFSRNSERQLKVVRMTVLKQRSGASYLKIKKSVASLID